ncbi:MAG: sortase [Candidatus Scatovivens sp.]
MDEKKFGNILTFLLIILIVIILGILGYLGYAAYSKNKTKANTDNALQEFQETISKPVKKEDTAGEEEVSDTTNIDNPLDKLNSAEGNSSSSNSTQNKKTYMEDFEVIGSIKIPKTNLEIPILDRVTKRSLEISVAKFDGPGLNQVGNTTIMGHNYRNGLFFSNNKKLSNGDEIFITDQTGTTVTYIIYNIYETDPNEAKYMRRDTNGKREISLSTCNDDSSMRLVIWAAEK